MACLALRIWSLLTFLTNHIALGISLAIHRRGLLNSRLQRFKGSRYAEVQQRPGWIKIEDYRRLTLWNNLKLFAKMRINAFRGNHEDDRSFCIGDGFRWHVTGLVPWPYRHTWGCTWKAQGKSVGKVVEGGEWVAACDGA
eukprot:921013-Pelagomonas_calceolata.AAC.5